MPWAVCVMSVRVVWIDCVGSQREGLLLYGRRLGREPVELGLLVADLALLPDVDHAQGHDDGDEDEDGPQQPSLARGLDALFWRQKVDALHDRLPFIVDRQAERDRQSR